MPYTFFPGIFSSIDCYSKRVVHDHFDRHGRPPTWLKPIGDLVAYREPPHWSRFQMLDGAHQILLTGVPDGIFVRRDETVENSAATNNALKNIINATVAKTTSMFMNFSLR